MKSITTGQRRESNLLRNLRRGFAFTLLASGTCALASATGIRWTGPLTIASIEVVGDQGGFVVYLSGFSDSTCSSNPTGIYIYPGSEGVLQAGANQLLAAALAARASGSAVNIEYDETISYCEGVYLAY